MMRQLPLNTRAIAEAFGRRALRLGTGHSKRLVVPDPHFHVESKLICDIGLDVWPEEAEVAAPNFHAAALTVARVPPASRV